MRKLLCFFAFFLVVFWADAKQVKPDFIVAKDGSGTFKTVQEAISAVPDFRSKTTTILIKKGSYKEKLILPASKKNICLIGESLNETILTFDDFAQKKTTFGEDIGTSGSASFFIFAEGFSAKDITFQNSAGPVGQAVAVFAAADQLKFINCKFLGFQDTLYTYGAGNRQYYKNCYIEGTVDFIFGSATAWFEGCEIFCKRKGYITAASTPDSVKYGYVFNACKIKSDAPDSSFYLGRPWRPYAKVVYLNCQLGKHIKPTGWDNWRKATNEKTAYYAEYNSIGAGANSKGRVNWSHQLNKEAAAQYNLANVFRNWNPESTLK